MQDKDNGLGCSTSGFCLWSASRHRRRKPANLGTFFFGSVVGDSNSFQWKCFLRGAAAPLAVTIVARLPGRTAPGEHAQVIEAVPGGCTTPRADCLRHPKWRAAKSRLKLARRRKSDSNIKLRSVRTNRSIRNAPLSVLGGGFRPPLVLKNRRQRIAALRR
jgi:hypothetical protein